MNVLVEIAWQIKNAIKIPLCVVGGYGTELLATNYIDRVIEGCTSNVLKPNAPAEKLEIFSDPRVAAWIDTKNLTRDKATLAGIDTVTFSYGELVKK
jgi:hypothetical protein